jgi:hypothetical protein
MGGTRYALKLNGLILRVVEAAVYMPSPRFRGSSENVSRLTDLKIFGSAIDRVHGFHRSPEGE